MVDDTSPIGNLVHLYVDGAFSRRELVKRVAKHTGSVAAAMTALSGFDVLQAQAPQACPDGIKVPADAPDLLTADVKFPGNGVMLDGYVAYPKTADLYVPAVIVIHENQGLLEHHRDVTRRVARAGFVGVAVDLLSRQGGVARFTDATQRSQAYGRLLPEERYSDLVSTLAYAKSLPQVQFDRIGVVGFCAGGGNSFTMAVNLPELAAAVVYYGNPIPSAQLLAGLQMPVLAIYAERDRNLTAQMAPAMQALLTAQKEFALHVYEGVGHAFHNDTGAAYNADAACDAWSRTIRWFNKYLLRPRT